MRQLAADNQISVSTGYDYLNEALDVLAARTPSLRGTLLAAKAVGYENVNIDGTLIETDRCRTPGPTEGVDLWWSGKHENHGGIIQVITAPAGRPIRTSDIRPGREHDTTATCAHTEILPALTDAGTDLRTPRRSGLRRPRRHGDCRVQKTEERRTAPCPAAVQ